MNSRRYGFTLVELMVIIAVIAILAGISVVGYGGWRERSAANEVKSDLINGANALQARLNFDSTYPATQSEFDSIYDSTDSVNIEYILRAEDDTYCLNGQSLARPSVQWMIDSRVSVTQPAEGTCS